MNAAVTVLVVLGLTVALALGIATGFDTTGVVLFALLALFGVLAIAVTRRSGGGAVSPGICEHCGGLLSPNAPYCKHCGEPR